MYGEFILVKSAELSAFLILSIRTVIIDTNKDYGCLFSCFYFQFYYLSLYFNFNLRLKFQVYRPLDDITRPTGGGGRIQCESVRCWDTFLRVTINVVNDCFTSAYYINASSLPDQSHTIDELKYYMHMLMHIHSPLWLPVGEFWGLPFPALGVQINRGHTCTSPIKSHSPNRADCQCPTLYYTTW